MRSPLILLALLVACDQGPREYEFGEPCPDGESTAKRYYLDDDGDGFGDGEEDLVSCSPEGYVGNALDCDDTDPAVHPDASEACNGTDDDCDGQVDEAGAEGESLYYLDDDRDGYGDESVTELSCDTPGARWTTRPGDCDDTDWTINPDATEIPYDGVDQDCDGEDLCDLDGDGYDHPDCGGDDCDDDDDDIHPGVHETWYDGIDQDCDGWSDYDQDLDHHDAEPTGDDCNDTDPSINPGVEEVDLNEIDDDCDGRVDEIFEYSLYFDGTDDYVTIDTHTDFDLTDALTFEAWIKPTDPNRDAPVLAKEPNAWQFWFGVYYNRFGLLLGSEHYSGWGLVARDSGDIDTDVWTHIASTWDGEQYANYQDGVLVDDGWFEDPAAYGTRDLTIGSNSGYDDTRYEGYIAMIRIWSVARTATQIADEAVRVADTTGLVAWWDFADGSGQVLTDVSGSGHDGQLGSSTSSDSRDPTWDTDVPED